MHTNCTYTVFLTKMDSFSFMNELPFNFIIDKDKTINSAVSYSPT